MSEASNLSSLTQNVDRIIDLVRIAAHDVILSQQERELKKLRQRLQIMSLRSDSRMDESLESDFLSIIETHPVLRSALSVVLAEELVQICANGLEYYAELQRTRPLTQLELNQLDNVKREHEKAVREWKELLEAHQEGKMGSR